MARDWGVTRWLVQQQPADSSLVELLVLPGDLVVIAVVLGVILLRDGIESVRSGDRDRPICSVVTWSLVAIVFGGLALIIALESLFGFGRPPTAWHATDASPYGFPSGHTMAATVAWGAIVAWYGGGLTRSRLLGVSVLIGIVGGARMALGLHYLPDVIAAIGFGAVYLAIAGYIVHRRPQRAFVLAIGLAVIGVVVSGAGSRALVALAGTIGGTVGWLVLEQPQMRHLVHGVADRLGAVR